MPSYAVPIANAVKAIIAALPTAPSIVEFRKSDVAYPRDVTNKFAAVIIHTGEEREVLSVSGAGSATDQGDVLKSYEVMVTIYGTNFGNVQTDMELHPEFVLSCKQALNKTTLAGVPSVYGTRLIDNAQWESQTLADGSEVSRFGLLFFNAETRLGN